MNSQQQCSSEIEEEATAVIAAELELEIQLELEHDREDQFVLEQIELDHKQDD